MPFAKGQSGNPGGRSKAQAECARYVRELGGPGGKAYVDKLRELAFGAEDEKVQLHATLALLDRGYGKPEVVEDRSTLTDEEYVEELAIVAREYVAKLSLEDRMKLLADPAPTATIQ